MAADTASVLIAAPAPTVFEFMSDPSRLDLWSFGTWKIEVQQDGLVCGHSLQTGDHIWVRIVADPEAGLIDYYLGGNPDNLAPRIFARIVPGDVTGHGSGQATLILTALRTAEMDDARWGRMVRAHAFEVDVVKSLIETGHDHRMRSDLD